MRAAQCLTDRGVKTKTLIRATPWDPSPGPATCSTYSWRDAGPNAASRAISGDGVATTSLSMRIPGPSSAPRGTSVSTRTTTPSAPPYPGRPGLRGFWSQPRPRLKKARAVIRADSEVRQAPARKNSMLAGESGQERGWDDGETVGRLAPGVRRRKTGPSQAPLQPWVPGAAGALPRAL